MTKKLETINSDSADNQVEDDDEQLDEEEKTTVSVFNKFANVNLNGPIYPETTNPIADFILRANLDDEIDLDVINLFIDTEGGDMHSAFRLIDAMNMSDIPIRTIGWGKVASAGLLIFMAGDERVISENCSVLSHNATFNAARYTVKVDDFSHQQEFKFILQRIMRLYTNCSGQDERYIKKHLLRNNDVYISAEDAIKHGIADKLIPFGLDWLKEFSNGTVEELLTPEEE